MPSCQSVINGEAYAEEVKAKLAVHDIRGFIDNRTESIGRKIRDTELKKVPFMLIVGEKEAESQSVGVRRQGEGDLGAMSISDFVEFFKAQL